MSGNESHTLSIRALLSAGAHFGHLRRSRDPRSAASIHSTVAGLDNRSRSRPSPRPSAPRPFCAAFPASRSSWLLTEPTRIFSPARRRRPSGAAGSPDPSPTAPPRPSAPCRGRSCSPRYRAAPARPANPLPLASPSWPFATQTPIRSWRISPCPSTMIARPPSPWRWSSSSRSPDGKRARSDPGPSPYPSVARAESLRLVRFPDALFLRQPSDKRRRWRLLFRYD